MHVSSTAETDRGKVRLIFVQLQESLPSEGRLVGKSRLDGARQLTKLREIVAGINGKRIKPFMLLTLIVSQLGCTTSPEFQEKEAVDKAISQTAESARNYLADTTLGDWNRLHGTQIEYPPRMDAPIFGILETASRSPANGKHVTHGSALQRSVFVMVRTPTIR